MTQSERLTLDQLAAAANMTARNVRAYQTRGLLQPPRREGRASVYGAEHVDRLHQVQRARSRGASLRLLRTLIAEGRDLDGVWDAPTSSGSPSGSPSGSRSGVPSGSPSGLVDVSDAALEAAHTADCLARGRLPLGALVAGWGVDARDVARAALPREVPGSFACAVTALDRAGVLTPAAALRLAATLVQAAQAVADAAADAVAEAAAQGLVLDDDRREAAAARLGELAGALVEQLVTASTATAPR